MVNHTDQQRLSVAPMMDWTDRHYRFLARQLTERTLLYTEMVVADDLLKKDTEGRALLLDSSAEEFPGLTLQLGGADPATLAAATQVAVAHAHHPWHSINLNCGCPSSRVTDCARQFGASLMHDAELVRDCVRAMGVAAGAVPVTVKCRLGTDALNGYDQLTAFVSTVSAGTGVTHFDIHARECVLSGLTPKQNRQIPPLRPRWAHRLTADFPHLTFSVNGGVRPALQRPAEATALVW